MKFEDFKIGKTRFNYKNGHTEYICHAIGDRIIVGSEKGEDVLCVSFNEKDFDHCKECGYWKEAEGNTPVPISYFRNLLAIEKCAKEFAAEINRIETRELREIIEQSASC